MKPIITIICLLLLCNVGRAVLPAAQEPTETAPTEDLEVLTNGLKVFIKARKTVPMVNIVFAVNVGSKDETAQTSGLVHLLEHLILLGETQFHDSTAVNQQMRRHGALFNAHTSHDLMTFEVSLPKEFLHFGLKMIYEKLFHLKFSAEKLNKEKEIIYEEISMNRDDPYKHGIFLMLQEIFKDHAYQFPISGNPDVIKNASLTQLEGFYKKYFHPGNSSLALVGDISIHEAKEKIAQIFRPIPAGPADFTADTFAVAAPLTKTSQKQEIMDIKQARLIIGFHVPPSGHPDQLALNLLDQIIGKGVNPLLPQQMVKRGRRLTYGVSTSYIPLIYGGAYMVFLSLEAKDLSAVRRAVLDFFNKTAWNYKYAAKDYPGNLNLRTIDYMETAKNRIKYDHQRFNEEGLNAASAYARYFLYHYNGKEKNPDSEKKQIPYMEQVQKIRSSDVRDAASRYFSGKKHVIISLMPLGKKKKNDED